MKLIIAFAGMAVAAAGPAMAQNPYGVRPAVGSASGSVHHPPSPTYGSAPTQKTYGPANPPKAEGFKPYKPFQGGSTYSAPKPPSYGAKPCETSVYVNACDKRR